MNKSWKDHFHYLLMPLVGALTVGVLWVNLGVNVTDTRSGMGFVRRRIFVVSDPPHIAKCRCMMVTERR